jgi:hypothetical protein
MRPLSAKAAFPPETILMVGQDERGRWMVQENHGLMEGVFVSRDAALSYAARECHGFPDARVVLVPSRLRSTLTH